MTAERRDRKQDPVFTKAKDQEATGGTGSNDPHHRCCGAGIEADDLGNVEILRQAALGLLQRKTHEVFVHPRALPVCASPDLSAPRSRARSLVADPKLLVCDEPTGDLDRETADEILGLLEILNRDHGKTVIIVTHDPKAAGHAKKTLHLDKGQLVEEAMA